MTVQQRIEAYKFALEKISNDDWLVDNRPYICLVIYDYAKSEQWLANYECNIQDVKKDFPEFAAQMPVGVSPDCGWWLPTKIDIRKAALKSAITLAESTLYHETVKTAVNELGLTMLPIPMSNCAKILHYIITMNGISCQDRIKAGHRARIADLRHRHGLDSLIAKEHLTAVDEFGETYYYKRHYVKPEHVPEVVLAYLRINCPKEVKARKSKVLEAMKEESV